MNGTFLTSALNRILQASLFVMAALCCGASVTASARVDRQATELVKIDAKSRVVSILKFNRSASRVNWYTNHSAASFAARHDQSLVCIQLKRIPVFTNFNTQSLYLDRTNFSAEPGEERIAIS